MSRWKSSSNGGSSEDGREWGSVRARVSWWARCESLALVGGQSWSAFEKVNARVIYCPRQCSRRFKDVYRLTVLDNTVSVVSGALDEWSPIYRKSSMRADKAMIMCEWTAVDVRAMPYRYAGEGR